MNQLGGVVQNSSLVIGSGSSIGDHCNIRAAGGQIVIGDKVMIANHVTIVASNHGIALGTPMTEQLWEEEPRDVIIAADVWIGAGVVLLPGCRIGAGAIIAAGAVVRGEVLPNAIMGGVPAKLLRLRGDA